MKMKKKKIQIRGERQLNLNDLISVDRSLLKNLFQHVKVKDVKVIDVSVSRPMFQLSTDPKLRRSDQQ